MQIWHESKGSPPPSFPPGPLGISRVPASAAAILVPSQPMCSTSNMPDEIRLTRASHCCLPMLALAPISMLEVSGSPSRMERPPCRIHIAQVRALAELYFQSLTSTPSAAHFQCLAALKDAVADCAASSEALLGRTRARFRLLARAVDAHDCLLPDTQAAVSEPFTVGTTPYHNTRQRFGLCVYIHYKDEKGCLDCGSSSSDRWCMYAFATCYHNLP